jgi:VWFA-related protein
MEMMCRSHAAAFVLFTGLACAQNPDRQDFRISTTVNLVLLDVSVRDSKGVHVPGLTKADFQVFEEGKPRPISFFAKEDEPVTVGLLIDNSGSMTPKRPEVVTAALAFIRASNPEDEIFVVNFSDRALLGMPEGVPFTSDYVALRDALVLTSPKGRTALYDGLVLGLEHLRKGKYERKSLVVVSDGGDNASARDFDDVMELARASSVTIYTIGIYDDFDREKNPGVLKRLARETGGEMSRPAELEQVREVCRRIADDIRGRYTLGFEPASGGRAYRKIRVTITDRKKTRLQIRTREGFRVAPD